MTTSATTNPQRPVLSGRAIGEAAKASGALLDRLLAEADLRFHEWTALFTLAGTGPLARSRLVRQLAFGLKVPDETIGTTVDGMVAAGLLAPVAGGGDGGAAGGGAADDPRLAPTAAGLAVYRPLRAAVDEIAERLYGDLPADDLTATRRTLDEVTRRANEILAS